MTHLSLEGVTKSFGGVHALRGVDFRLSERGTVHGLIGANGSGKSTLLGILSGQLSPDSGTIALHGERVELRDPAHALSHGIAMVSQETALAPHLSVAENILLGRRLSRSWWGIDWKSTGRRAAEVLARLDLDYDPRIAVSRLRPDQRQMVEIARALSIETSVLILDEPTSSLSDDQVRSLFDAVRRLKSQGVSTIFVSHRLPELFELSDEVTVLRDGLTVATGHVDAFDQATLVDAMVGEAMAPRRSGPLRRRSRGRDPVAAPPRIVVQNASSPRAFTGVSLTVSAGEIVGLAGLTGAGRGELLESLFGARGFTGAVSINGIALAESKPAEAISAGAGYLPPDRKTDGVVLQRSIFDNLSMVTTLGRRRLASPTAADSTQAAQLSARLSIKAPGLGAAVGSLSGGNQQKVAIGKWLGADKTVLLLDEPTRGVDIAAKREIHSLLRDAADHGTALLVSSSETDELIELCDRILVMHAGIVVADVAAAEATEPSITHLAGGHL
ncbi:sugar ABC transporter ATP-binding protein [Agromyces bauzanensis]